MATKEIATWEIFPDDMSSLAESDSFYSNIDAQRPLSHANVRFHALQRVPRDVSTHSMKVGRTNRNALNKLDIHMRQEQAKINEVYHSDAVSVHSLGVRPSVGEWNEASQEADLFKQPRDLGRWMQVTKGLANFSSIKLGDERIQRISTAHREEYRSPSDRKEYGRPAIDPNFRNIANLGHQGCGLFRKSFQMLDEQEGDDASTTKILQSTGHPAMLSPNGGGGEEGTQSRLSLYRNAAMTLKAFPRPEELDGSLRSVQLQQNDYMSPKISSSSSPLYPHSSPQSPFSTTILDDLSCLFRFGLQRKICKGTRTFRLQGAFAFLDRSGRGGFDLEDFRKAVDILQLDFNEAQTIALFAKYDRGAKGYVDYSDFMSSDLAQDPTLDSASEAAYDHSVKKLTAEHIKYSAQNQHLGQPWQATPKYGFPSRVGAAALRERNNNNVFRNGGMSSPAAPSASVDRKCDDAYSHASLISSSNASFAAWLESSDARTTVFSRRRQHQQGRF